MSKYNNYNNIVQLCSGITCEDLDDVPQGSVSQMGNTPGSRATYSCISGYRLSDDQPRQCQDNGKWSGVEPSCISKNQ